MKQYISHILLVMGIFSLPLNSYSQRTARAIKNAQIKSVNKKSVGLVTSGAKITCSNPGDPKCIGPNETNPLTPFGCPAGQKKADNNDCICEDDNYIVSPDDKTKCILKSSPVATALKKECGNVLIKAVSAQCKDSYLNNGRGGANNEEYKCYDASELYSLFDTSSLHVYIEGKDYRYDDVCYIYTEDLMKSIASDYDISGPNSIACKRARAIANASSECFSLVLSTGKALGATDAIKTNLQKTCGTAGINQQYQKLFGEVPNGVTFPTNLPDLYTKAGKGSFANGLDMVGKWMDGKITDKTDTWEREITVINNSYLNQVSAHCGSEYAVSMHNEDIQIVDEKSSLQRMIDEKGSIAGVTEWVGNQASVVVGEHRINKIKREGLVGGIKDEDVSASGAETVDIGLMSSSYLTDGFRREVNNKLKNRTDEIPYALIIFTLDNGDTTKYYRLIKLLKSGTGSTLYTYETVDYKKDLNLPSSVLQEIIGRTEKTDINITNGTITGDLK